MQIEQGDRKMNEIKLQIKGREQDTFAIHYSCECFHNGGAVAPAVCTISIVNYKSKELHTFALHNYMIQGKSLLESEQQLLKDFIEFYKSLNNPLFIHWAMDSLEYGFKAIYARAENYGLYDFDLSQIEDFNLSEVIDSGLIKSLEENNCKRVTVLGGKDEAICFNKRAFDMVKMSTEGKVLGIMDLFEKYLSNDLVNNYDDERMIEYD